MEVLDIVSLDREVRRASERLEAWRAAPSADRDPFGDLRHVATQTTYRTLAAMDTSMGEALHRDALLRWVHELLQARIGLDLEVDEHEAMNAVDPHLARGNPAGIARTWNEAWSRVVRGTDLARLVALSPPVLAVRRERRIRREEAMRRLAVAAPTLDWASRLLEATEPLSREILGHARKRLERSWCATDAIALALATDAREGWPAQLLPRWLDEVFAPLGRASVATLPEPLGGASFLRAAARWGFARRLAGTPRALPFALARDPYAVPGHRFAWATSVALADPLFTRKVLGVPERLASTQARALRTTLLLAARTLAGRVLVAGGQDAEEITTRIFGGPLLAAWPSVRVDDPARVVGVLAGHDFVSGLVERFDEDWFRNPKAGAHLDTIAAGPAFDDAAPAAESPARLARWFEQVLG